MHPHQRAEWTLACAALSVLAIAHLPHMNVGRFVAAFAMIDLVGYLPLALRPHHLTRGLYNVTHSFLTAAVVLGAWALAGPEWAMLAIPIHLAGDRGLFGNQPFAVRA
jgi:hypothetical protein